jgi:hypothetical protein
MSEFNYYLEGDELWCEGVRLGPSDALFLDTRQTGLVRWLEKVQPEAGWPRLVTYQLPYGDYVFVSKNGVVAIESKTIPDLMGSYERRRLQRQLRHLLTAAPMAILGIVVDSITPEGVPSEILLDVAKWDMSLGSTILIPSSYSELIPFLVELRATIAPGAHLLSVVAGTDAPRVHVTDCSTALERLFNGVGRKTAVAIAEHYGQDLRSALNATEEEWLAIPEVHKGIIKSRRRLVPCTNTVEVMGGQP